MNKRWIKLFSVRISLLFCTVILILASIATQTHLSECVTDSLSGIRYLLFMKNSTPHRGDIVSIQGHAVKYVGTKPLAKRVLGLPADQIVRDKDGVKVKLFESQTSNSKPLALLQATRDGKPLTPLNIQMIPQGYVFVAGDNPNSFDSRYEEFGLVPMEKIWGKAVFTW